MSDIYNDMIMYKIHPIDLLIGAIVVLILCNCIWNASWSICTSDIKWYINRSINHYPESNGMGIHVSLFRLCLDFVQQQHCQGLMHQCGEQVACFSAANCRFVPLLFITRTVRTFPQPQVIRMHESFDMMQIGGLLVEALGVLLFLETCGAGCEKSHWWNPLHFVLKCMSVDLLTKVCPNCWLNPATMLSFDGDAGKQQELTMFAALLSHWVFFPPKPGLPKKFCQWHPSRIHTGDEVNQEDPLWTLQSESHAPAGAGCWSNGRGTKHLKISGAWQKSRMLCRKMLVDAVNQLPSLSGMIGAGWLDIQVYRAGFWVISAACGPPSSNWYGTHFCGLNSDSQNFMHWQI